MSKKELTGRLIKVVPSKLSIGYWKAKVAYTLIPKKEKEELNKLMDDFVKKGLNNVLGIKNDE